MELLNHPVIQKYFGPSKDDAKISPEQALMAYKLLKAMQEPIGENDLFLVIGVDKLLHVELEKARTALNLMSFHAHWLRLPDRFQKK
jgi:hypothetical protein